MPEKSDTPLNFWQELKRRKVVRVIIVYAAAAYVILELVSIISEPFGLPDWTLKLVFVLLCIGLIISVILSWIYDITPQGVQKTRPARKDHKIERQSGSNGWKIATYAAIIVILGLLIFNITGSRKYTTPKTSPDKSIAVIPFKNFSNDPDQEYMCLGLTDEIINHLFKIESFDKVVSLSSVLAYRDSEKLTPEIATELRVNYILEGTYKKIGNQLRVTAQLIEAEDDKHLWQQEYDRSYEEIISLQSDIALQIADHLDAFLTGMEKENIQRIPTTNQEAYELLQEAQHIFSFYRDTTSFTGINERAFSLVLEAIKKDPEYSEAYAFAGQYILATANYGGDREMRNAGWDALDFFQRALDIDPGNGRAHLGMAQLCDWFIWDYVKSEKEFLKAMEILPNHPMIPSQYGELLVKMGRFEDARHLFSGYEHQFVNQYREINRKIYSGSHDEAIALINKMLASWNEDAYLWAGEAYMRLEKFDSALHYLELGEKHKDPEINMPRFQSCLAAASNKTGNITRSNEIIHSLALRSDTSSAMSPGYFTGWYFARIGEIDSAFRWLEKAYYNRSPEIPHLKVDPAFKILKADDRYWDLYERTGFKAYADYMENRNNRK